MKVVVTSGAGFIGSRVVDPPIEAGQHVVIVDNLWEHGGGTVDNIRTKAHFHQMDLRGAALQNVFVDEQPEGIFDCSRACHELRWEADIGIQTGLRLRANYFKESLGIPGHS